MPRRQIVDDEIDGPFPQLEPAHRVVGQHLHHDAAVLWRPVEIIGKRREHEVVVDAVPHELIGTRADGMRAEVRTRSRRYDRQRSGELIRKGSERLRQREDDVIVVQCPDALERSVRALERREEGGIDHLAEREDDVVRGHLATVVKLHAAAERGDVGERIGIIEALGKHRLEPEVVADIEQRVEHELTDALRCFIVGEARIGVVRAGADAQDDCASRSGGLWRRAGGAQSQNPNPKSQAPGDAKCTTRHALTGWGA